jgi:hypothetical protein
MELNRLIVYFAKVDNAKGEIPPAGGEIELTDDVKAIFEPSFLDREKGGPRKQPFHFNFDGDSRKNVVRERVLSLLSDPDPDADVESAALDFAVHLQKIIDDRIGDLLLTIGLGWDEHLKRCVLWVFPSDSPIQLRSVEGKPTIREIKQAFTRKSKYRKAVYFQGPAEVGRNDFLRGELIDSTRQGQSRSVV